MIVPGAAPETESLAQRLARAKAYPFGHPPGSYLFRAGRAEPIGDVGAAVEGRAPVLVAGSNAAPAQLARKYHGQSAVIPVTRARLKDFDSVYNAHIAAYGSVPATLFPSPGTVLSTFVTWLDEAALEVMHVTEQPGVNYHFAELSGIDVEVDGLGRLSRAFAYVSVAGCLVHAGGPVALAEMRAEARRFPALAQAEALALVRDRCAPGAELDAFILETVADEPLRRARSARLAAEAQAFLYAGFRPVALRPGARSR